jgi:HEPN domain-containing protein
MKPATLEWIEKAEADWRSAHRESRVRDHPNHDLVCFLCQQCAEKYLKARLVEAGASFPKTHDLVALLKLLHPIEPGLLSLKQNVDGLSHYAVEFRYPGESATRSEARESLANARLVRSTIRMSLGLDEPPSAQLKLQIKEARSRYRTRGRKR